MKEATISISDELQALLDRYWQDQHDEATLSALAEAALRQYLRVHGYIPASEYRPLRITPAEHGSGKSDVSIEHDRYLYESPE